MPASIHPSLELNVNIPIIFDFVRANYLNKSLTSLSFEVFEIICKTHSVELIFSSRLQSRIRCLVSNLIKRWKKSWSGSGAKKSFKNWCDQTSFWKIHVLSTELAGHALVNKVKTLKSQAKKLKRENRNREITRLARRSLSHKRFKARDISSYSRSQQFKVKSRLKDHCAAVLKFLGLHGYEAHTVQVKNSNTKEFETFTVVDTAEKNEASNSSKLSEKNLEKINLAVLVKDSYNISDEAFNALAKISNLPRLCAVKKQGKQIGKNLSVTKTPSDKPGIQRSLEELLKLKIEDLARCKKIDAEHSDIHVKLTGDGTFVGKHIHFVNVTFTVLNDEDLNLAS
ncbi:uncharacterized protein [Asterias amurensis]|uniref:uncharacterized protein n=1 Tax=Asterias amurensis TaxID=7602 RepID=UPI003AB2D89B